MDNDSSDMSFEAQFRQQIGKLCVDGKKTVLMKKDEYFQLIEEVKMAHAAEIKTGRQYYILRKLVLTTDITRMLFKSLACTGSLFLYNSYVH